MKVKLYYEVYVIGTRLYTSKNLEASEWSTTKRQTIDSQKRVRMYENKLIMKNLV